MLPQLKIKYSVLSYLFGDYEHVREIRDIDPYAEYILVTDRDDIVSKTWTVVKHDFPDSYNDFDKVVYVRYHPFEFVSNDVCVKVDHSVALNRPLSNIVDRFNDCNYDMALMIHPERNTLDEEYTKWIVSRKYPKEQAFRCMSILKDMGYDFSYKGLYQLTFSIQKNDNITKSVNDLVWSLNKLFGGDHQERIDQITFSFVMNKYFSYMQVMPLEEKLITDGRYMRWYLHGLDVPIPMKFNLIDPYLFNERVEIVDF